MDSRTSINTNDHSSENNDPNNKNDQYNDYNNGEDEPNFQSVEMLSHDFDQQSSDIKIDKNQLNNILKHDSGFKQQNEIISINTSKMNDTTDNFMSICINDSAQENTINNEKTHKSDKFNNKTESLVDKDFLVLSDLKDEFYQEPKDETKLGLKDETKLELTHETKSELKDGKLELKDETKSEPEKSLDDIKNVKDSKKNNENSQINSREGSFHTNNDLFAMLNTWDPSYSQMDLNLNKNTEVANNQLNSIYINIEFEGNLGKLEVAHNITLKSLNYKIYENLSLVPKNQRLEVTDIQINEENLAQGLEYLITSKGVLTVIDITNQPTVNQNEINNIIQQKSNESDDESVVSQYIDEKDVMSLNNSNYNSRSKHSSPYESQNVVSYRNNQSGHSQNVKHSDTAISNEAITQNVCNTYNSGFDAINMKQNETEMVTKTYNNVVLNDNQLDRSCRSNQEMSFEDNFYENQNHNVEIQYSDSNNFNAENHQNNETNDNAKNQYNDETNNNTITQYNDETNNKIENQLNNETQEITAPQPLDETSYVNSHENTQQSIDPNNLNLTHYMSQQAKRDQNNEESIKEISNNEYFEQKIQSNVENKSYCDNPKKTLTNSDYYQQTIQSNLEDKSEVDISLRKDQTLQQNKVQVDDESFYSLDLENNFMEKNNPIVILTDDFNAKSGKQLEDNNLNQISHITDANENSFENTTMIFDSKIYRSNQNFLSKEQNYGKKSISEKNVEISEKDISTQNTKHISTTENLPQKFSESDPNEDPLNESGDIKDTELKESYPFLNSDEAFDMTTNETTSNLHTEVYDEKHRKALMDLLLKDLNEENDESSIGIEVDNGFIVTKGKFNTFLLYCVRIFSKSDYNVKIEVYRRYSDFDWLFKKLGNEFPGVSIPTLPDKDFWSKYVYNTEDKDNKRRSGLNDFMNRIQNHQNFKKIEDFHAFLFFDKRTFSLYKNKSQKNMNNLSGLKTVNFKERLEYFISSTLERPPTLFKTGETLMNQYLMTKGVYIRLIYKNQVDLQDEITRKNEALNGKKKYENISARVFLDSVIITDSSNEEEQLKYIKLYDSYVEKNNDAVKQKYDYGCSLLEELEKVILKKKEIIIALNKRDEIHEKREILWGKWSSSKTNQFDQDAYILENDQENLQEVIKTTDKNQYNEIQNYQEIFELSFANWLKLMESWFQTYDNN